LNKWNKGNNRGWSNPRDSKGRFICRPDTVQKFTEEDVKKAFIAGMNSKSSFLPLSRQAEMYLDKIKNGNNSVSK